MPHPKAKPVEIDGITYLIAPLTMHAIEQLGEITAGSGTLGVKRAAVWAAIHASLDRGAGDNIPSVPQLKDLLDVDGFLKLQQAVYELSAVRVVS